MTIRVVLADDQELVRAGFRLILDTQDDIEVVAEAADGFQAVAATRAHQPDVALLDIRMPGLDGIEAARIIVAETPCRAVMLTTYDQDEYVFSALRAGASGFLLKDGRREDLVDAVRTASTGDALLAPSVTRRLIAELTTSQRTGLLSTAPLNELTSRERETLRLIAEGLSNTEIAEALVVSTHTVKSHVSHLLTKLDLRDRAQAVIVAYETGLVAPGERPGRTAPEQ